MNEKRVLVWTPTGRDAALIHRTLKQKDFEVQICVDASDVCVRFREGAAALILAQESLAPRAVNEVTVCINQQPSWSDIPVILILSRDKAAQMRLQTSDILLRFTNLVLLERPVYPVTLVSLMQTAMRARQRQYDVAAYLEEKVQSEQRLEQRVLERTRQLQSANEFIMNSLREKEVLLKEIHHRVKNNLQIISSLLRMQLDKVDSPSVQAVFQTSQDRIQSMALIHETLYQSRDLNNIDFGEYVKQLMSNLRASYSVKPELIHQEIRMISEPIGIESALACGLILNELVTNSFKHAFPNDREGTLHVHFRRLDPKYCEFEVGDDGIGIPEATEWEKASSMGLRIVRVLTQQLQATCKVSSSPGTTFTFKLPNAQVKPVLQPV